MQRIGNLVGFKPVDTDQRAHRAVFNPATGEQIAELGLSSTRRMSTRRSQAAKAALPAWANTPPLKRARFMFNFKELLEQNADAIARAISREHGKTHADALGEVQRGIEVVEFACGIPHLLKGEFSRNVGPAIDTYSDRQPLGVVRRHHAVQLPGHGAALDVSGRDRLRQHLHPEAVGARPVGARCSSASSSRRRASRTACFNVVHGDKEAVDAHPRPSRHQGGELRRLDPDRRIRLLDRQPRPGSACQALGGAKNHMVVMPDADMDQAADALLGAGYGSAGERCMAISVAVPVGEKTADALVEPPAAAHPAS